MPNIIHAADLHIGAKFEFLPPESAAQAIRLQLTALKAGGAPADFFCGIFHFIQVPVPDFSVSGQP